MKRPAALIAALLVLAATPAQQLFDKLRANVRANLEKVPRYTCVQTVTRTQFRPQYGGHPEPCSALIRARDGLSSRGLLVWHDRLRLDVAVGDHSEMFSWAGAKQFETGDLQQLTASGSTGSGDFGAFLASIFGEDAEEFRYMGEQDTPVGRLAAFDYTVPYQKSHYTYRSRNGSKGTVGYSGTFYVVPATAQLRRLTIEANDFRSGDVCRVRDTMDYALVHVGTGDSLLPDVARMVVLYQNGEETENETHYSNCHEFTGESTIRFDDSETPAQETQTRAELKELPPNVRIPLRIDPPIDSATAAAGDPITAMVEHEVRQKGQVIVRTTDRFHGRFIRLEQFMLPQPEWVVAIRFETIERNGVEEPVRLKSMDDGDRTTYRNSRAPHMPVPPRPAGAGLFVLPGAGNLVLDRKFHSEWETQ